jgi:hypothetical protein
VTESSIGHQALIDTLSATRTELEFERVVSSELDARLTAALDLLRRISTDRMWPIMPALRGEVAEFLK